MITLKAYEQYNERFAPSEAKKAYVARITGRDSKMTFAREFLGKGEVHVDTPGLYETRSVDKKGRADEPGFRVVLEIDGDARISTASSVTKEDAMKIAKRLDAGESIDRIVIFTARPSVNNPDVTVHDASIISPKDAEKQVAAQTVDVAVEACRAVLSGLSEKDVKKVLAAIKALKVENVATPTETPQV